MPRCLQVYAALPSGMRVIAGKYRSRQLQSPPGTSTRPTSDRLRETLFNILSTRVDGSRFVDLYAGTGAVGIEALSRGAAHVWFAENGPQALKTLRANLQTLEITQGYALEDRGTGALLQRLLKLPEPVDILYIDPPYEAETEYAATLAFLGSKEGRKLLAPDALLLVEHASKAKWKLAERYGILQQTRIYKQGDTTVTFFAPDPPVIAAG